MPGSARTHYRSLIDNDWLGQWDLEGAKDQIVQIENVFKWKPKHRRTRSRDILQRDGTYKQVEAEEPIKRVVVFFVGKRKPWLAGPVSQQAIAKMYGDKLQDWIGKRIALYVDESVTLGKKSNKVGGIRVRPTIPTLGVTTRSLDQPVDQVKAEEIAAAIAETSGARAASSVGPELESARSEAPAGVTSVRSREPGEEG